MRIRPGAALARHGVTAVRCALLGALTLGSASAGQGQEATVRDETFTAAFDGTPQQYVLQLPPKFDADARTTY